MSFHAAIAALILALFAAPAFAQPTPFDTLAFLRQQYPPIMSPAQVGELLNREAWIYRNDGMKLLGKAGGNNCPTPAGVLISCDYLVHGPTVTGHDVISGRDDGTQVVVGFTWGPGPEPLADAIALKNRTLVDPVEPAGTVTPQPAVVVLPPPGTGTGGTVPQPAGTGAFDATAIIQRLLAVETEQHEIKALAAEGVQQIKAHRAGVQAVWLKVSAIGGPLVATLLTYLQMRGGSE